MIQSLHIENYALIEQLDMELHKGFSVITGETGAGKSIILGAIGLLRGGRADTRAMKAGAKRCVVEAEFDVSQYGLDDFFQQNDLDFDGQSCIIRRELTAAGKSRAFINDTPVSLALLKEIGDQLIDIHSQHQNLLLGREDFQLSVLDIMGGNESRLTAYGEAYQRMTDARKALDEAVEATQRSRDDEDYLRFQFEQLSEAQLHEDEQAELEAESEMLEHAEEIKQELYRAARSIDGSDADGADVLQRLKTAMSALHSVESKYGAAGELAGRIDSCYIELKDIAQELDAGADDVEYNPQRLSEVNERLNLIYSLEQKHHVDSVEELLAIEARIDAQLAAIDGGDERVEQLRRELKAAEDEAAKCAAELSDHRRRAAQLVEQNMVESLQPLGMPNVRFAVAVEAAPHLLPSGADTVQFLFSANKNGTLQNVAQVASGGEIARVMLSLKALIASAVKLPTIIFDEIDTGVSGSIAEKMARIMQRMGEQERQVISITHLPQIAALGSSHYRVYKEDDADATRSHIVELSHEERVEELAHMLSGETLTEAAVENARELLRVKS